MVSESEREKGIRYLKEFERKKAYEEANEKALEIFQVGSKEINYKILQLVPTTIAKIRYETKLTKMPVYNRVKALDNVGLIKLRRGEAIVENTPLGEEFLRMINRISEIVVDRSYWDE